MIEVRVAEAGELAGLVAVEDAADGLFGAYGIVFPASSDIDEVADPDDVLVVGRPAVGFAYVGDVDDGLHLHQLAVHPDHGRRGLGTALLAAVFARAAGRAVTLTTFRHIPWNEPWYRERGFSEVVDPGPELKRLVEGEAWLRDLGERVTLTSKVMEQPPKRG
ncbi:GNAT family N-acetyltransferase [Kutzneria sp. CA-103260]|uniref:GNAT family N-acetyltransferase n=1 Tax=Kutzneria sp. CA-103260 TaxID=2802641 RepID=UPI001BA75938|nr:GNAT family N-acetyltransferase [Kutzneria sp. CA-103260]QUQ72164.1 Acetyltransferase (GNAT) domain protein [Kutzneria sp. CA-103260]